MSFYRSASSALGLLLAVISSPAMAQSVVASIKPVHALVAAVMAGVGEPGLLVRGHASPHAASLRPSQARLLQQAELVFWIGPEMETFLEKPIATLSAGATAVALMEAPSLTLLPVRSGAVFGKAERPDDQEHGRGGFEPHIWLDPANAIAMVEEIENALAGADPARADLYRSNAADLRTRLSGLSDEIAGTLAPVRGRPFFVFHDAYSYFENRFDTMAAGAFTVGPEDIASAQTVAELVATITREDAACLFSEPQFQPRLIAMVAEATGARIGVLDPLGASLEAGPELYFTLLRNMARALRDCLTTD